MIQGAMSSVGKSLLVAALCRIFAQDGLRVAPFKAQNMALNSYVTRDGLEVGRAQAMQAEAAGADVTVEMNPVLIKPEADAVAQIVVLGKPWQRLAAWDYFRRRQELWQIVTGSLDRLRAAYDLVVIEGAGSPAELNLRRGDLVNMAIAAHAEAPVLLVGDIDRGGVFAQLLGTLFLLEPDERARVRGLIVNKFRGDIALFHDGVAILEARGGVPVLGVVPFIPDLRIADEDSVALDDERRATRDEWSGGTRAGVSPSVPRPWSIDIVVIRLPHISNFDDFDPLRAEPDVRVRFVGRAGELGQPDLVVLPGTKTTIVDLAWLRERGLADRIVALAQAGTAVLGICGGYQMLGNEIRDPHGVEAAVAAAPGLGLLPLITSFEAAKQTVRSRGVLAHAAGLFRSAQPLDVAGYEIHMGHSQRVGAGVPLLQLTSRREYPIDEPDGLVTPDGWIAGTYLHGLFENDGLRHAMLANLAERKGMGRAGGLARFDRAADYDRLAATVRASLDMARLRQIIGL
jgi:adenosylcobyric acid synthase